MTAEIRHGEGMAKTMDQVARAFEPATRVFDKATCLGLLDAIADGACTGLIVLDENQTVYWARQ